MGELMVSKSTACILSGVTVSTPCREPAGTDAVYSGLIQAPSSSTQPRYIKEGSKSSESAIFTVRVVVDDKRSDTLRARS